jgi:hypothetical protein
VKYPFWPASRLRKAAGAPIAATAAARQPISRPSSAAHSPIPAALHTIRAGTNGNSASGSVSSIATGG